MDTFNEQSLRQQTCPQATAAAQQGLDQERVVPLATATTSSIADGVVHFHRSEGVLASSQVSLDTTDLTTTADELEVNSIASGHARAQIAAAAGLPLPGTTNLPTPAPSPQPEGRFVRSGDDGQATTWNHLFHQHRASTPVSPASVEDNDHDAEDPGRRRPNDYAHDDDDPTTFADRFIQSIVVHFPRLTLPERRKLFNSLMPSLQGEDLLHLSQLISPYLRRDFLAELPAEIALHILAFVDDPKDLVRASRVSRTWRSLVSDEQTWKVMLHRYRGRGWTAESRISRPPIERIRLKHPQASFGSIPSAASAAPIPARPHPPHPRLVSYPASAPSATAADWSPSPASRNARRTIDTAAYHSGANAASSSSSSSSSSSRPVSTLSPTAQPFFLRRPSLQLRTSSLSAARPIAAVPGVSSSSHRPARDLDRPDASGSSEATSSSDANQHRPSSDQQTGDAKGKGRASTEFREGTSEPQTQPVSQGSPTRRPALASTTSETVASWNMQGLGFAGRRSSRFYVAQDNGTSSSSANGIYASSWHPASRVSPLPPPPQDLVHRLQSLDLASTSVPIPAGHGLEDVTSPDARFPTLNYSPAVPLSSRGSLAAGVTPGAAAAMASGSANLGYFAQPARPSSSFTTATAPPPPPRVPLTATPVVTQEIPALPSTATPAGGDRSRNGSAPTGEAVAPSVSSDSTDIVIVDTATQRNLASHNLEAGLKSRKYVARRSHNPFGMALTTTRVFPSNEINPSIFKPSIKNMNNPLTETFSYKRQFKRAYLTESNWLKGPGRTMCTQTSASDNVVTSLGFDSDYIVVGMASHHVHVFDARTGEYAKELKGHTSGVWCLVLISRGGYRVDKDGNKLRPAGQWKHTGDGGPSRSGADDDDMSSGSSQEGTAGEQGAPSYFSQVPQRCRSASARAPDLERFFGAVDSEGASAAGGSNWEGEASWSQQEVEKGTSTLQDRSMHPGSTARTAPKASTSSTKDFRPRRPSSFCGLPVSSGGGGDSAHRRSDSSSANGFLFDDGKPSSQQAAACGTASGWGQRHAVAVTAGCDRDVRVWDVDTGRCLHVLRGHGSTVRCLKALDGRPIAVSGSRDATLRVWDIERGVELRVLAGHRHSVRCIEINGNKVVSGSYDTTCRIWDVDTGECLHVLEGHQHQIYAVAFDGVRVASGSLDSTVRIWSAKTGQCLALLQGHTSLVGQLQLTDSVLVTGGSDGRVIVFSLSTFECLHRLCAHDNSVTCLQFNDRFMVTGGNDGRVKLWDRPSGRLIRELAEPCEAVYRVTFREDKCVLLCKRAGRTVMDVRTFAPYDDEL